MVKKITLLMMLIVLNSVCLAQVSVGEDAYNGFSSRSFMKFNNFMTVPTFSLLHRDDNTLELISRSSNIEFEDASRLHIFSYSGKMRENVGAGIAVFQQEIGAFKDFGAVANYAYQLQLGAETKLTFGFNFFYSRRGLDQPRVLTNGPEPLINNYQDKPVVVFQPAATVSFGNFDVGLFFENIGDFNLKNSEFVTPFSDKTISAHAAYTYGFESATGLFENTTIRGLGIARRSKADGFSYAGNFLVNLPKAGWLKAGYDKVFGLNAGIGIHISERLGIGFAYEKQDNLGGTNEVGLIYKFGAKRRFRPEQDGISRQKNPQVQVIIPETKPVTPAIERREEVYDDPEHNDLSDEVRIAQDSINKLNKKVNEILKLLENQPKQVETIRETPRSPKPSESQSAEPKEDRDKSLRRSTETPWRERNIIRRGGGGTMYYVAIDQFKDFKKVKSTISKYKKRKIKLRYVKDPKYDTYVIYVERFARKKDAEEIVDKVNSGRKGVQDDGGDDEVNKTLGIDLKALSEGSLKDPLYVIKVTLGAEGETFKEPKTQGRARVRRMKMMDGLEEGYYLVANVFSQKAYADKFLDELENDNINAGYFINPETGYRHVYIHKGNDRAEAIKLYKNNLNGTYYNNKNIVHIK